MQCADVKPQILARLRVGSGASGAVSIASATHGQTSTDNEIIRLSPAFSASLPSHMGMDQPRASVCVLADRQLRSFVTRNLAASF